MIMKAGLLCLLNTSQLFIPYYKIVPMFIQLFISSPYILKIPKAQATKISSLYSKLDNQTEHNPHMLFATLGECDSWFKFALRCENN